MNAAGAARFVLARLVPSRSGRHGTAWPVLASRGQVWRGEAGEVGQGNPVSAGRGSAGRSRCGWARQDLVRRGRKGWARFGEVCLVRAGVAGQVQALRGKARLGAAGGARPGMARCGPLRHWQARHGTGRHRRASPGLAGVVWLVPAGRVMARFGRRGRAAATRGPAWLGTAGLACHGWS